jgi:hypothetical protein
MTKLTILKTTLVALCLVAGGLVATGAYADGFSVSFGFGNDDGAMLDSGISIGDRMGYPLITEEDPVGPLGPVVPFVVVDRAMEQHKHYCRLLRQAEAEMELLRQHWHYADSHYERGPNRTQTMNDDAAAIEKWMKIAEEYRARC